MTAAQSSMVVKSLTTLAFFFFPFLPKVDTVKLVHPIFLTSSLFLRNCCGAHGEGGRKPVSLCALVYFLYFTGRAIDMVSFISSIQQ
jgi:hypothetical protein